MTEYPKNPLPLNKEQLDALRLETQDLSPKEKRLLDDFMGECHQAFLDIYGKYIPKKKENAEITQRFLKTTEEIYEEFVDEWSKNIPLVETTITDKGYMRYHNLGEFLVGYLPDLWGLLDEKTQIRLKKREGGFENAKNYVRQTTNRYLLSHEIAHMYQDPNLPVWFMECGAHYYARTLMMEKGWGKFDTEDYIRLSNFYQTLVGKYGEDVHKLFFGQLDDKSRREEILAEFTEDVQKCILPHYRVEWKIHSTRLKS